MKHSKSKTLKRVSKKQWLKKALYTLGKNGIGEVKITGLAKALGTSRSGFYWHFSNRQDLRNHILDFWANEYTGVISNNPVIKKMEAKKRLLFIIETIRDKNLAKYDLAIFAWAKKDPVARKAVKKVVKMRLDYIRDIFAELGFEGDDLEMRTRLFVVYHSWESTMFAEYKTAKPIRLQKLRHNMLTK